MIFAEYRVVDIIIIIIMTLALFLSRAMIARDLRSILNIATFNIKQTQQVSRYKHLVRCHAKASHDAVAWRNDRYLHLHRLEDQEHRTLLNTLSFGNFDLPNRSADICFDSHGAFELVPGRESGAFRNGRGERRSRV